MAVRGCGESRASLPRYCLHACFYQGDAVPDALSSAAAISRAAATGAWALRTTRGTLRAGVVANCAGLAGDTVEAIARPPPFHIRPRKVAWQGLLAVSMFMHAFTSRFLF